MRKPEHDNQKQVFSVNQTSIQIDFVNVFCEYILERKENHEQIHIISFVVILFLFLSMR